MSLGAALAIYGGAKAIGSFAAKRAALNKRKKFAGTEYGKELKRQSVEGMYSPKARGLITGSVARKSGGVAQTGKASFAGRLAARGLEGSIAGQRGLNEYDIQQQKDVAESARSVEMANEQSKVDAKLTFAQKKLQDEREREALKLESTQALIGDLGGVAGGLVNDYFSNGAKKQEIAGLLNGSPEAIARMASEGRFSEDVLNAIIAIKQIQARQGGSGQQYLEPYQPMTGGR